MGKNFEIGHFWIFAVNIFAVAFAPRPRPLLASTVRSHSQMPSDPGIKIFAVNIFTDYDRSAKILTREIFQLYGMWLDQLLVM